MKFGERFIDNYQYLEKFNSPQVVKWINSENDLTENTLSLINQRPQIYNKLIRYITVDQSISGIVARGAKYFYYISNRFGDDRALAFREGPQALDQVIFNPNSRECSCSQASIDWFSVSNDGHYVAYGISYFGSEQSELRIYDTERKTNLSEKIEGTSESIVSWRDDNQSFFYLKLHAQRFIIRKNQIRSEASFLHFVGRNVSGIGDPLIFSQDSIKSGAIDARQASYIRTFAGSPLLIGVSSPNMERIGNGFFLTRFSDRENRHNWREIARPHDNVIALSVSGNKIFFATSSVHAPMSVFVSNTSSPDISHAKFLFRASGNFFTKIIFSKKYIFLFNLSPGKNFVSIYSHRGKIISSLALPYFGTVNNLSEEPQNSQILFSLENWITSPELFSISENNGKFSINEIKIFSKSKVNFDDIQAHEETYRSADGTNVPVSIIEKATDQLNGKNPLLLIGYGSYGESITPEFHQAWRAWLDYGGIIAIAHVRGGGELGERWHEAGMLGNKPNSIADFIECARYLISKKYTSKEYLVASGASAGGILLGGALRIQPSLFKVVLDKAGFSDTVRIAHDPNGPPNFGEFGSPYTASGFHNLLAISSYSKIENHTPYPAAIFLVGTHDSRVAPWQSLKMAARLQAASSSSNPVLLRVDSLSGHSSKSSVFRARELADAWSFALWQVGQFDTIRIP
ncbi:prolyl oligopeptidase family serine peptidase [Paraburkholderia tropica]|uniref:prolyl oligopeptidase family serine peptidase n=1 Tax=Paraburkholderia tropica TaxID=92647 RepID=UPI002AB74932|nr:prolyl oligopeptidase family serine peptidase [Paraburkholderia tropica]